MIYLKLKRAIQIICIKLFNRQKYVYEKSSCFLSLLLVYGGTVIGINQNYTHIKVVFYYNNPSSYPDTGRSIQDILGGHYELKKAFFYEDIKNYRFLEAVMTEQPVIIEDFDALRIRKEFVDCLCIISLDYRIVLSFTYTERKDEYCTEETLCEYDRGGK